MSNDKTKRKGQRLLLIMAAILLAAMMAVPCVAVASDDNDSSAETGAVTIYADGIVYNRNMVTVGRVGTGGTPCDITYTAQYLNDPTVTFYVNGAWTSTAPFYAGDYTVKLAFAAEGDLDATEVTKDFTIAKKELTLPDAKMMTSRIYDGTTDVTGFVITQNLSGIVAGDTITLVKENMVATVETPDAGENKPVTITGLDIDGVNKDNYYLTIPSLTITIKSHMLTVSSVTNLSNKVYDGTKNVHDNIQLGDLVGIIGSDVVNIASYTATIDTPDVGQNKPVTITITLGGTHAYNYYMQNPTGHTIDVVAGDPSYTVEPTAKTGLVYNGTAQALMNAGSTSTGTIKYKLEGGSYDVAVPTGTGATTYKVYYKIFGDKDHGDSPEKSVNVTISKASTSVSTKPNASAITYGQKLSDSTLSGGAANVGGTFAWASPSTTPAVSDSGVTEYTVNFTPNDTANYNGCTTAVKITVNKADVAWPSIASKTYTGSTLKATIASSSLYTVTTNNGGINVGKYSVTLTLTDSANYKWADVNTAAKTVFDAFEITKASNSWTTALSTSGRAYNGTELVAGTNYSAAAKFGTVVYTLYNSATGGSVITEAKNAGTYYVTAKVAGTANYDGLNETARASVTITKAKVTITPNDVEKYYGGADPEFTFTKSQPVAGETIDTQGALARTAGEVAGKYPINIGTLAPKDSTSALAANYEFVLSSTTKYLTIKQAETLTKPTADTTVFTYNGSNQTYSPVGFDSSTMTISGNVQKAAKTSYTVTVSITEKNKYKWTDGTQTDIQFTFTISKKTITISGVDATDRQYDGTKVIALTGGSLVGVETGDASAVGFTLGTGTITDKNVGNGKSVTTNIALTGAAKDNYSLTQPSGITVDISQRGLTVKANASQSKTYGNADPTFTYTVTFGTISGETPGFTGALIREDGEDVGTYTFSNGLTLADNGDFKASNYYVATFDNSNKFEIKKATITVTPGSGQSKVYGTADPSAYTYTYTGAKTGETPGFSGKLTRVAGEDVGSYAITKNDLALADGTGGFKASNYTLVYSSTVVNFTITPATVTKPTQGTHVFAYTSADITYTPAGFSDSTMNISGNVKKNVGTYNATISLKSTKNYKWNDDTTASFKLEFSITAQTLTITGMTATDRQYDGTNVIALTGGTLVGILGSDKVEIDARTGTVTDKNVGNGKSVTAAVTLKGAAKDNYVLTQPTGLTVNISQRDLTVAPKSGLTKEYGELDPTLTVEVISGSISGETPKFTGSIARSSGEDVGSSYTYTQGTLALTDNSPFLASNYNLIFIDNSVTFSITAATITVTPTSGLHSTYGSPDVTITYTWTGEKNSEVAKFSGALSRESGTNAGTYTITLGNLTLVDNGSFKASNYTLVLNETPVSYTVDPLAISITKVTLSEKTYDGKKDNGVVASVTFNETLANTELQLNRDYTASATYSSANASAAAAFTATITMGTTTAAKNFSLSVTTASDNDAVINPKDITVTLVDREKEYDGGSDASYEYTTGIGSEKLILNYHAGDILAHTYTYTSGAVGVATYNVTVTAGAGTILTNYNPSINDNSAEFEITKRLLKLPSASASDKTYDNDTACTTYISLGSFDRLVGSDDVKIKLGWTAATASEDVGTRDVIFTGLELGGDARDNYKLETPAIKIKIVQRTIDVSSAVVKDRAYNGNTTGKVESVTFTNLAVGDSFSIGADYTATAVFRSKDVGTSVISDVTAALGTSDLAKNYVLDTKTCTSTSEISKADVTFKLPSVEITYDRSTKTYDNYLLTGVSTEKFKVTYTADSYKAGTYYYNGPTDSRYTVSYADYDGALLSNYNTPSIATNPGTFTIKQKELTVSGTTSTARDYNGSNIVTANVTQGSLVGICVGDTVSIGTWTATVTSANAEENKAVTITATLTGADKGNYKIKCPTDVKITINKKEISVSSVVIASKDYNGNSVAVVSSFTFTGLVGTESLTVKEDFTYLAHFEDENVGTNKDVTGAVDLSDTPKANNYEMNPSSFSGTGTINKKAVTLAVPGKEVPYTRSNTATETVTISLPETSETVIVNYKAYSYNAGSYTYTDAATPGSGQYSITWSDGTGKTGNYTINVGTTGTFLITPIELTLPNASASSRVYNGEVDVKAKVTLGDLSGILPGDETLVSVLSGWTAVMTNANAGEDKPVIIDADLTGTASGNYYLTDPTHVKITIEKADSAVTAAPVALNPTYTGSALALVSAGSCTGGTMQYKLGSGSYSANIPTAVNASDSYVVYYYVKGDINHKNTTEASVTAKIEKAPSVLVTAPEAITGLVYTGSELTLITAGTCTGGELMYKLLIDETTVTDFTNVIPKATNANKYTVMYYVKGDSNHINTETFDGFFVTIAKADIQNIVHPTLLDREYDSTEQPLITAGSCTGGTFWYALDTEAYQTTVVSAEKAKTYPVYYKIIGDSNHNDYAEQTVFVTISKKILTLPFATADARDYNGEEDVTNSIGLGTLYGIISGDVVKVSTDIWKAEVVDKNAGENKPIIFTNLYLTGADAANYLLDTSAITITINPLKVILDNVGLPTKTYDGNDSFTSFDVKNKIAGDRLTVTGSFNDKNVATGKTISFALSGADAANYSVPDDITDASITARDTLIQGLVAADKTYDGKTDATILGTPIISALVAGDIVTVSYGTATFDNKKIGTDKTVTFSGFTLVGKDKDNYNLVEQPADVKADITVLYVIITGLSVSDKTYDGTPDATVTGTGSIFGKIATDTVSISSGTAKFVDKNVGTKVARFSGYSLTGTDAANYYLVAQPADATAKIKPLDTTISGFTSEGKVYDSTTVAKVIGTGTVDALISGDTVTIAKGTAAFSSKAVGMRTVTFSGFALIGTDAANYKLTAQPTDSASYEITKATLTVGGIAVEDKVYDGKTAGTFASKGTLVGVIGTDAVSLKDTMTAAFSDKKAGADKTVTLSGYALQGTDAGNYSLTAPSPVTASISKLDVTIIGMTVNDKVYDGKTTATYTGTPEVSGKISGDEVNTISLSVEPVSFADKNAGSNKVVNFEGFILIGADKDNYNLVSQPTGKATITHKSVTISGIISADKVYDGSDSAFVFGSSTINGKVAGDSLSVVSGTAKFNTKYVGNGKTVYFSGFALTGDDATNYVLTAQPASVTNNITPKELTVSGIVVKDKVYDGTMAGTFANIGTLVGVVGSDKVSLDSGMAAEFNDKNVGTGKTVTLSGYSLVGADAGNYSLTEPSPVTASITKMNVVITGQSAKSKVYNGTDVAELEGTPSITKMDSDDVTIVVGNAYFSDKNVGTGKTVYFTGFSLTGADAGNYNLVGQPAHVTKDITKKDITVAAGSAVPTKEYDGTTYWEPTGQYYVFTGVEACDVGKVILVGKFNFNVATTAATKVIATELILAGDETHNYNLTTTTYEITGASITAKTILASDVTWVDIGAGAYVYNAMDQGSTVKAFFVGINGTVDLTVTFLGKSGAASEDTVFCDAGAYTATATNTDISYKIGTDNKVTKDYTMGKAQLTIFGKSLNAEYNGTEYKATAGILTAYGLVKDTHVFSAATFTGTYVGTDVTSGTFSLSSVTVMDGSNDVTANYSYTTDGPWGFTIYQRALYASAGSAVPEKVYDGTTAWTPVAGAYVFQNLVGTDDVQLTASYDFNSKNVLEANYVKATGLGLIGAKAGNYCLKTDSFIIEGASITPKHVNVDAAVSYVPTKVYDGVSSWTPTLDCYQFDGVIVGDDVTLVASYNYTDSNVLTANKKVIVTDLSLAGGDADNYILDTESFEYGSAEITVRTLNVTPASGQFKYYGQPDPVLVCAYTNNVDGEIPGFSGALVRDAGEIPGSYLMYQGTIAIIDNGSFIASNYVMSFTGDVFFKIISQDLLLDFFTVDTSDEVYDGIAKYKSIESQLVLDEDYTVTYKDNINAGTAKIILAGIGDYSGTLEYTFIIQKAGIETPEPRYYLYTGEGVYFNIPESPYYKEDSGNPRFGIEPATYYFHFTLVDSKNYKWADEKFDGNYSVYITIRELKHTNEKGVADVILLSDYGFRFDLTPNVTTDGNPSALQEEYGINDGTAVFVYGISLYDKQGKEVQPYGNTIVKILVPDNCAGGAFDVYHIHAGDAEKVDKHFEMIDGHRYVVFTVDGFSDFLFVKQSTNITLSLFVIMLIIDTIIALYILATRNKKDEEEQ